MKRRFAIEPMSDSDESGSDFGSDSDWDDETSAWATRPNNKKKLREQRDEQRRNGSSAHAASFGNGGWKKKNQNGFPHKNKKEMIGWFCFLIFFRTPRLASSLRSRAERRRLWRHLSAALATNRGHPNPCGPGFSLLFFFLCWFWNENTWKKNKQNNGNEERNGYDFGCNSCTSRGWCRSRRRHKRDTHTHRNKRITRGPLCRPSDPTQASSPRTLYFDFYKIITERNAADDKKKERNA